MSEPHRTSLCPYPLPEKLKETRYATVWTLESAALVVCLYAGFFLRRLRPETRPHSHACDAHRARTDACGWKIEPLLRGLHSFAASAAHARDCRRRRRAGTARLRERRCCLSECWFTAEY